MMSNDHYRISNQLVGCFVNIFQAKHNESIECTSDWWIRLSNFHYLISP